MKNIHPANLEIHLSDSSSLNLILVEGGTFTMGNNNSEYEFEKPEHPVKVSSFYMGKYQVTQQLWQNIMGKNPSEFKGENRPVERVSWDYTKDFLNKLNSIEEVQNHLEELDLPLAGFRLPTEAEWEYAARGGKYSQGYTYSGSDKLKQVGWYVENSGRETHDVGLLLANELGIYDMSGNVWEWCEDDWHDNYKGAPDDSSAWIDSPERGGSRVVRGGGCFGSAEDCRPSRRGGYAPDDRDNDFGFRLCLSLQSVG